MYYTCIAYRILLFYEYVQLWEWTFTLHYVNMHDIYLNLKHKACNCNSMRKKKNLVIKAPVCHSTEFIMSNVMHSSFLWIYCSSAMTVTLQTKAMYYTKKI